MITLEGYEIEEMRSINHIMTVELQFKTPVTQKEARDYLSRVLTKANEIEAKAEKEICEKIFNTGEVVKSKEPEPEGTIFCTAPDNILEYMAESDKRLNELNFNFPQEEETANESLEIADDNPEIVNKETENAKKELYDEPLTEKEFRKLQETKKLEKEKGKPGPKRTKIDWDKACALKKAGWSNNEIATEVHAPVGTINSMIYQRMKEYNEGKRVNRCEEIKTEEA